MGIDFQDDACSYFKVLFHVLKKLLFSTFRFVSLYRGPCHTYKVQRLSESTSYRFCIQACNEAGEGPLSQEYVFTTPKSVPAALKGKGPSFLIWGVGG